MFTMEDIIREGHPSLRKTAEEVPFPLDETMKQLGDDMLVFLQNSQDPELAEKYELRGGVGLAAPQLDRLVRVIAILVPSDDPEHPEPLLSAVMYNPKIISHSVKQACLEEGEGCLSVDRDVPGYVVRNHKITISYQDQTGESHRLRLSGYQAIVVQHEIDHLNGIMFFDHIDEQNPYALPKDTIVLD